MKDPWEKAYGRYAGSEIAHIVVEEAQILCDGWAVAASLSRTAKPYPVCKNCLRTERAKELGLS